MQTLRMVLRRASKIRTLRKLTERRLACRSYEEGYQQRTGRTNRWRAGSPGNSGDERRLAFVQTMSVLCSYAFRQSRIFLNLSYIADDSEGAATAVERAITTLCISCRSTYAGHTADFTNRRFVSGANPLSQHTLLYRPETAPLHIVPSCMEKEYTAHSETARVEARHISKRIVWGRYGKPVEIMVTPIWGR